MAGMAGLEPATLRLTAPSSAIELHPIMTTAPMVQESLVAEIGIEPMTSSL